MEKYVLYDRVKALCEERGITINKLETELGFSVCSIQKWKAPGAPKVDRIAAVAGYFGVSIDYLMGASDIRSKAEELAENNDFIVLQRAMARMSSEDRERSLSILKAGFAYAFPEDRK